MTSANGTAFRSAWGDLTYFWWLLGVLAGTPSIISIIQMVYVEGQLIAPIQSVMDAYTQTLEVLGAVAEPWIHPFLTWIGGLFGWDLTLHPHWRPIFVLMMVYAISYARGVLRDDLHPINTSAGLLMVPCVAIGTILAGSVPLEPHWLNQGLITLLATLGIMVAWKLAHLIGFAMAGYGQSFLRELVWEAPTMLLVMGAFAFGVGSGISFIPGMASIAGFLATGLFILWFAQATFAAGAGDLSHTDTRIGLMIVGPFIGAALIYAADWAIRAYGG